MFTFYVHHKERHRVFSFSSFDSMDNLPDDTMPVDILDIDEGWRTNQIQQLTYDADDDASDCSTFQAFLTTLPPHKKPLLAHYELLHDNIFNTCHLMSNPKDILLVSDGGAVNHLGSFGWILGLQDGTRLAHGSGIAFGQDPHSF